MNDGVFSVFDAVAKRYLQPFFAMNIDVALRGFKAHCNKEGSQFNAHPMDFFLFHLGEFNAETGAIDKLKVPAKLAMAADLMEPTFNPNDQLEAM